uniref:Uncharacterized protein n=1 Tax=Arundo donax TaxID=35708 RepID=A0A0A9GQD9_ARUDO
MQCGLEGLGEPGDVGPPAPPGEAGVVVVVLRPIPRADLGVLPPALGTRLRHHSLRRGGRRLFALVLRFARGRGERPPGEDASEHGRQDGAVERNEAGAGEEDEDDDE